MSYISFLIDRSTNWGIAILRRAMQRVDPFYGTPLENTLVIALLRMHLST